MSRLSKVILWLAMLQLSSASYSAITLSSTRVILDANKREKTVLVTNHGGDILLQSWIEAEGAAADTADMPLAVSPPLVRIDAGKEQLLRIMYQGEGLPQDRESAFWLNAQEIPAQDGSGQLQLAIQVRVKLFFRPKGLVGTSMQAVDALSWQLVSVNGENAIKVINESAFHITLVGVGFAGGKGSDLLVKDTMIEPKSSALFKLKKAEGRRALEYRIVDDYGATKVYTVNLRSDSASLPKRTVEQ